MQLNEMRGELLLIVIILIVVIILEVYWFNQTCTTQRERDDNNGKLWAIIVVTILVAIVASYMFAYRGQDDGQEYGWWANRKAAKAQASAPQVEQPKRRELVPGSAEWNQRVRDMQSGKWQGRYVDSWYA